MDMETQRVVIQVKQAKKQLIWDLDITLNLNKKCKGLELQAELLSLVIQPHPCRRFSALRQETNLLVATQVISETKEMLQMHQEVAQVIWVDLECQQVSQLL